MSGADISDDDLAALLRGIDDRSRDIALNSLTAAQRREYQERWGLRAHRGQREPEGDWRVWLIRAGRGFGKTRAGAEWVSAFARAHDDARIALVGDTADDVAARDDRGPERAAGSGAAGRAGDMVADEGRGALSLRRDGAGLFGRARPRACADPNIMRRGATSWPNGRADGAGARRPGTIC